MRLYTDSFKSSLKDNWKISNFDTQVLTEKDQNFVEILDNKNIIAVQWLSNSMWKLFPMINKYQC